MNGLRYLIIVGMLLAIPAFAKRPVPMAEKEGMQEPVATEMATPSVDPKALCEIEQPTMEYGPITMSVRQNCPCPCFEVVRVTETRQPVKIHGCNIRECVKCDQAGVCTVVPQSECCCKEVCKPVCHKERCCKPVRRCCPKARRCCK